MFISLSAEAITHLITVAAPLGHCIMHSGGGTFQSKTWTGHEHIWPDVRECGSYCSVRLMKTTDLSDVLRAGESPLSRVLFWLS